MSLGPENSGKPHVQEIVDKQNLIKEGVPEIQTKEIDEKESDQTEQKEAQETLKNETVKVDEGPGVDEEQGPALDAKMHVNSEEDINKEQATGEWVNRLVEQARKLSTVVIDQHGGGQDLQKDVEVCRNT